MSRCLQKGKGFLKFIDVYDSDAMLRISFVLEDPGENIRMIPGKMKKAGKPESDIQPEHIALLRRGIDESLTAHSRRRAYPAEADSPAAPAFPRVYGPGIFSVHLNELFEIQPLQAMAYGQIPADLVA